MSRDICMKLSLCQLFPLLQLGIFLNLLSSAVAYPCRHLLHFIPVVLPCVAPRCHSAADFGSLSLIHTQSSGFKLFQQENFSNLLCGLLLRLGALLVEIFESVIELSGCIIQMVVRLLDICLYTYSLHHISLDQLLRRFCSSMQPWPHSLSVTSL